MHPSADIHATAVVDHSVVMTGVRIGEHAVVRDSVILPGARVDPRTFIDSTVSSPPSPWGRPPAAAPTTAPPTRSRCPPADIQAALKKGGTLTVWAWEPTLKKVATDFETEVPEGQGQPGQRGHRQRPVHRAAERHRGRSKGVPDVAQIEYYALRPVRPDQGASTDLGPYGADKLDGTYTPGPVERREVRRRRLRPADGLRPDGAVLQQEGLRQVQASPCRPPGTSTSRPPASCTRPTRRPTSPATPATPASPPA